MSVLAHPQTRFSAHGFPAILRAWRQRQRLSQMDLALEAGVSNAT